MVRVVVCFDKNIVEEVVIEVESLEALQELLDNDKLFDVIQDQKAEFEEVCGEILNTQYDIFNEAIGMHELYEESENGLYVVSTYKDYSD